MVRRSRKTTAKILEVIRTRSGVSLIPVMLVGLVLAIVAYTFARQITSQKQQSVQQAFIQGRNIVAFKLMKLSQSALPIYQSLNSLNPKLCACVFEEGENNCSGFSTYVPGVLMDLAPIQPTPVFPTPPAVLPPPTPPASLPAVAGTGVAGGRRVFYSRRGMLCPESSTPSESCPFEAVAEFAFSRNPQDGPDGQSRCLPEPDGDADFAQKICLRLTIRVVPELPLGERVFALKPESWEVSFSREAVLSAHR